MVKGKNQQIAICTYTDKFVDIIRHESQRNNSLPYWPHNAADNVANTMGTFPGHIVSNASIQQISFRSRFNAIEPEEVRIRLYENIANGSGLDISMMGQVAGNTDARNFDVMREVYRFTVTMNGIMAAIHPKQKWLYCRPPFGYMATWRRNTGACN